MDFSDESSGFLLGSMYSVPMYQSDTADTVDSLASFWLNGADNTLKIRLWSGEADANCTAVDTAGAFSVI